MMPDAGVGKSRLDIAKMESAGVVYVSSEWEHDGGTYFAYYL